MIFNNIDLLMLKTFEFVAEILYLTDIFVQKQFSEH
jgi:hypothetical protein